MQKTDVTILLRHTVFSIFEGPKIANLVKKCPKSIFEMDCLDLDNCTHRHMKEIWFETCKKRLFQICAARCSLWTFYTPPCSFFSVFVLICKRFYVLSVIRLLQCFGTHLQQQKEKETHKKRIQYHFFW